MGVTWLETLARTRKVPALGGPALVGNEGYDNAIRTEGGRTAPHAPRQSTGSLPKRYRPPPRLILARKADYPVLLSFDGKHWTFRPVLCVRRSPSRAIPFTLYATAAW